MRTICPWLGLGAMLGGGGCVGEVADKAPATDDTGQDSGGTHTGDTPDSGHTGESGGGDSRDTEDTGHTGDTDSGYTVDSCWQTGHDPADTALPGGYERGEWLADAEAVVWGEELTDGGMTGNASQADVIGDLNGDGWDDLFVGVYSFAGKADLSGAGYLMSGPFDHDVGAGDAFAFLYGSNRYDAGQVLVLPVNDLDADGMEDLVVVMPGADSLEESYAGYAAVLYGPLSGGYELDERDKLVASVSLDGAFWGAAAVNDYESDGMSGFLLSMTEGVGVVHYYNGPVSGTQDTEIGATATMYGTENDGLGAVLASGEDTNGDGIVDIAVGSYGTAVSGGAMVCLVSGPPMDTATIPDTADYCVVGDSGTLSVAVGADVTGDSLGEVFIGRPFVSSATDDREQILVMEGGATELDSFEDAVARLNGPREYGSFGLYLDTGEHSDTSGFLVTQAYSDASSTGPAEVFVMSGPMSGVQEMEEQARVVVDDEPDQYLFAGTGGDLTGDGIVDIVAGNLGQTVCGVEGLGAVYILGGYE